MGKEHGCQMKLCIFIMYSDLSQRKLVDVEEEISHRNDSPSAFKSEIFSLSHGTRTAPGEGVRPSCETTVAQVSRLLVLPLLSRPQPLLAVSPLRPMFQGLAFLSSSSIKAFPPLLGRDQSSRARI